MKNLPGLLSSSLLGLLMVVTGLLVSPSAAADELPIVQIPFGCGLTFPVSQAHDTGSHVQYDTYAWDFRMPEGIPIVAAGDGVVRMARGDSTEGGCDPEFASKANYVVIDHPNGYETQYLHFQIVVVKAGESVRAGQLLGYSGKTGWACGSHLHFKVALPKGSGWNNPSVPATLAGYGDPQKDMLIAAPACPATAPLMAIKVEQSAKSKVMDAASATMRAAEDEHRSTAQGGGAQKGSK